MKTEPLNERVASLTGTEAQRDSGDTAKTLVPNSALILQTFGSSLACHTAEEQTTKTSADGTDVQEYDYRAVYWYVFFCFSNLWTVQINYNRSLANTDPMLQLSDGDY